MASSWILFFSYQASLFVSEITIIFLHLVYLLWNAWGIWFTKMLLAVPERNGFQHTTTNSLFLFCCLFAYTTNKYPHIALQQVKQFELRKIIILHLAHCTLLFTHLHFTIIFLPESKLKSKLWHPTLHLPIRHNYNSLTPAISVSPNLECYKQEEDDANCLTAF